MAERSHVWMPFTHMQSAPQPLLVHRGRGALLELDDGRELVDCISSWWVTLHGHGEPAIAQAIAAQADELEQVIAAGFTHAPGEELAAALVRRLPGPLDRVFYSDNGSTAVEVALKVAVQHWRNRGDSGRTRFIAFSGAYHGATFGAMSVGARSRFTQAFGDLLFAVDFVDYPSTCWEDAGVEEREARSLEQLRLLLEAGAESYAAVIVEPLVQGAGGMRVCREQFLRALQELVREYGLLTIYDEVLVAFGRCGALFACQKAGTEPDIVCLAKGLTGGFLPLAVTACTDQVYASFMGEMPEATLFHGHSYAANPLGCAAALASLDLLEARWDEVERIEAHHRAALTALADEPALTRARLCGTIAAVDLCLDEGGGGQLLAAELRRRFLERGYLLRPLGSTVYMVPPYCIQPEQLDGAYHCIREVAAALAAP